MIGIALWYRSTFGLVLAAGLFVLFHAVVVYVEEPGLEKRFGESYRQYMRNVPRWLPRLRPWSDNSGEPAAAPDRGGRITPEA
jgi:protein-S-isoprenylcysteine O-methyltransferase Ste14